MDQEKELLARAKAPTAEAMRLHPFYRGKVEISLKSPVRNSGDFAIWYTPGVAGPCEAIAGDKEQVYRYTNKGNCVAVVSDGTRVLGLGDIGPEAGLPVMEGKALLFKYLGGVDAVPLCVQAREADDLVNFVKMLQPSFGGINLEDIESPKCFDVLERLRRECSIPVWHDDQQGTALVTLAGLINALKIVRKKIDRVKIVLVGAGAANLCTARLLIAAGADPGRLIICDRKGTLHQGRGDLDEEQPHKWQMAQVTNRENLAGATAEAFRDADVAICLSQPGPATVKKEWVKQMAPGAVLFACANPIPEIWPWEAKEAGAKIVATGRSDFPNQVNNSLGFPAIFRGVLDVRATAITDGICIAAAKELAACAPEGGLNPEKILPSMDDEEIFPRVATATAMQAIAEGKARLQLGRHEIYQKAEVAIKRARRQTSLLMEHGIIPAPPDE
ncbi:MAG: NADP-dependent malic enzyme [Dethiobacteria bacterium]